MIVRRTPTAALSLLLAVLGTGCYSYVPVPPMEAPARADVRMRLSEPARQRLLTTLWWEDGYVDGRLVERSADTLLLEIDPPDAGDGYYASDFAPRVAFARDEVVALEVRELDRTRTYAAAGILAAGGVALLARMLSGKAGGGPYPPTDDGSTEGRIPVGVTVRW